MIKFNGNENLSGELEKNKFVILSSAEVIISPSLQDDLNILISSWNGLVPDGYLKEKATFRERRFGLFEYIPFKDELIQLPEEDYFQSAEINQYAGGITRKFSPLLKETYNNKFLSNLIKFNFQNFPIKNEENDVWKIDVHQFRIIGKEGEQGEPTPEGIHHDDDDFNAIHLINRSNVSGGVNGVYDNDKKLIAKATLMKLMDTVYVWDPFVMHGVSPIYPENLNSPAIRDVLVIGYNKISN